MRRLLIAAAITALSCGAASAQLEHMEGTISVRFEDVYKGGKVTACQLVYNTLTRDYVTRDNYMKVDGSIALSEIAPSKYIMFLKVRPVDILFPQMKPFIPASAHLMSGNTALTGDVLGSGPSDTGGLLVSLKADAFDTVVRGLAAGSIRIAFKRYPGSFDTVIPISTRVKATSDEGVRTTSAQAGVDFMKCADTIFNRFKNEEVM